MKKKSKTIFKNIAMFLSIVIVIIILIGFILFSLSLPYKDILAFFSNSNYFWFNGRRIAYLATAPMFFSVIMYLIVCLMSKNFQPSKRIMNSCYLGIICVSSFLVLIILNILALFFYLYIYFFTSFHSCQDDKIRDCYVNDQVVCEKLYGRDPLFKW